MMRPCFIFSAQQVDSPEVLYPWQWQLGRIFKALGKADQAISAFREAVYTIKSHYHKFLTKCEPGSGISFKESIQPIFFGLADLLLHHANTLQETKEKGPYLFEARETIEFLKAAELRDYFNDPCLGEYLSKNKPLEGISISSAIVYIISLPERLELLLSLPKEIKNFTVPISAVVFTEEVKLFRKGLENRTTREYLPHAQRLYNWLIQPLEESLAAEKIDTLVFVTGGALRNVPLAALHDGLHFLVEKYALANTLGLNLTDPRPIKREEILTLLAGLTEPVQGYPALPNVSRELQNTKDLFDSTLLVNQDFSIFNLKRELENRSYNILHIASHAEFKAEAEETHILAWNEKITMDHLSHFMELSKFRPKPIELLILSACQTAAGDEKAALGLAGVAVKAGARSTLATLWRINDVVSSELIVEFYTKLMDSSISKARALQLAQIKLLGDERFRHPCYWSPFLMIGNWL